MKLISIDKVEEYMILARNVYDDFGKILLSKETVLTSNYIDRLKNFGITSVYVVEGLTDDVKIEEMGQKQNEAPETPLNNEHPKTEPGDTMLEVIRFTNNIINTLSGEKTAIDGSLHSINSLGTEPPFMTTNMTNSQDKDFQPLLTRMEKDGTESDFTGITTNMSGGGINQDALFSNLDSKSGPPGAISEDDSVFSKNIDQKPGRQTAFTQAKGAYQAYKEAVSTANEIQQGETIRKISYGLLMELVSNQQILPLLMKIKTHNEALFMHGISTCVLSIMTGMGVGYELQTLKGLGAAALLHDIGKIYLAPELLDKKKAELTAEESMEIQKHVQYGYEFLKNYEGIPGMAATVALRHHERMDGSGYPNHLKGNDINHFARIVALADVYDNLSTDKAGGGPETSTKIMEYIQNMSDQIFDREFAAIFLKNIRLISSGKKERYQL